MHGEISREYDDAKGHPSSNLERCFARFLAVVRDLKRCKCLLREYSLRLFPLWLPATKRHRLSRRLGTIGRVTHGIGHF
jgi:hypothetical protein